MGFGYRPPKKKVRRKSSGPSESRTAAAVGKRAHQRGARSGPSVVRRAAPSRPSPEAGSSGKTRSQRKQTDKSKIAGIRGNVQVPTHTWFQRFVLGEGTVPSSYKDKHGYKHYDDQSKKAELRVLSPALKILNETTRVSHGVAGIGDAWVSGHPERAAGQFKKGLVNNKPYNWGKNLQKLGLPKGAAKPLGLAADIALDPVTYVTFGTGGVTRRVAEKEIRDAAEREAAKQAPKGLKGKLAAEEGSVRVPSKKSVKVPTGERGITMKFAGKQIPGVTAGTAKIGKAASKAIPKRPVAAAKRSLEQVNPRITPEGVTKGQHHELRKAARTARATVETVRSDAMMEAHALQKVLGAKNYQRVVDAIEADTIDKLPAELQGHAHAFAKIHGPDMLQAERAAGVKTPSLRVTPEEPGEPVAKAYVYRAKKDNLGKGASGGTTRTLNPDFGKGRQSHTPLAVHPNAEAYSSDVPLLHVTRKVKSGQARASAQLNTRIAEIGRAVKPGAKNIELKGDEELYHFKDGEIRALKDGEVPKTLGPGEKLFVLSKAAVERAHNSLAMPGGPAFFTGFWDPMQRGFKRVATATPGFNVRNLVGDEFGHYLEVPGHTIPKNFVHGRRIVSVLNHNAKHARKTLTPEESKWAAKTVEIPGEGKVSYATLAKQFLETGGGQTGQVGRELEELGRKASPRRVSKGAGRVTRRVLTGRENLPRAQTWIHYRMKGLSPEEASAKSAEAHFDYGETTGFEKDVARRIMPFYTFSARNIPRQGRMLLQKPGKFATLQKVREESGIQKVEQKLSEYDQRQLPIKVGEAAQSVSLPATDLNEFPILAATGHPLKQADEYANRFASLVAPLIKDPIELKANHSFFFRDAIENPDSPLVPAPSWVRLLPEPLKKKFGVTERAIDNRTGKRRLMWYGKADYVVKQIPGIPNFAQNISTVSNRRGQSTAQKATAFLTGVKATPLDKITFGNAKLGRLYDSQKPITRRMRALNKEGVTMKNPTAEYKRLNARNKKILEEIYKTKKAMEYKKLPKQGKPKTFDPLGLGGTTDDPLGLKHARTDDPLGLKP